MKQRRNSSEASGGTANKQFTRRTIELSGRPAAEKEPRLDEDVDTVITAREDRVVTNTSAQWQQHGLQCADAADAAAAAVAEAKPK